MDLEKFIETLRAIPSVSVLSLAGLNHGSPQLIVGYRSGEHSINVLVEVKSDKNASLSESQMKFRQYWKGPIVTVTDANQVMKILRRMTEPKKPLSNT